jgi:Kef-type K+ transport system membrane component KefB
VSGLVTLLLQVAAIVVATRLIGHLIGWIGQPRVVGEMLAGILLGPSLLGWAAPAVSRALFPPQGLAYLNILSQLGLLLFMFLVGLEFNTEAVRSLGRVALATSVASIAAPFGLGAVLAYSIYPQLADPSVPRITFVLFLGTAMSVTAFPVLARILADRQMTRSELGVLAIACASVDDVCAWFILAYVAAFAHASNQSKPLGFLFAEVTVFALVMILAIRPGLERFARLLLRDGQVTENTMGVMLLLLLLSAAATEWLGIHLLFGAFLFGAILPRDPRLICRETHA